MSLLFILYFDIVHIVFDSPVDEFFPHFLGFFFIELPGPHKSEQVVIIPSRIEDSSIELLHKLSKVIESL